MPDLDAYPSTLLQYHAVHYSP